MKNITLGIICFVSVVSATYLLEEVLEIRTAYFFAGMVSAFIHNRIKD